MRRRGSTERCSWDQRLMSIVFSPWVSQVIMNSVLMIFDLFWWCWASPIFRNPQTYPWNYIYVYIYIFVFLPMIIMIRLTTTMIVNSNIIYQQWWCDIKQTRIIKSVWSQDDLTFSPSKPSRKARSLALMPPNSRENYWMPARMMRSENHRCGWRKSCTSW